MSDDAIQRFRDLAAAPDTKAEALRQSLEQTAAASRPKYLELLAMLDRTIEGLGLILTIDRHIAAFNQAHGHGVAIAYVGPQLLLGSPVPQAIEELKTLRSMLTPTQET